MTNVFKFPEHKIVREVPVNIEEIEKAKEKGKQNYAEDIVIDFAENILAVLDSYGIDQDSKHFGKDLSFTVETIRALIYRSLGLDHHLHDFVDSHVSIIRRDKNGNLVLETPENVENNIEEIIISEIENLDTQEKEIDSDK